MDNDQLKDLIRDTSPYTLKALTQAIFELENSGEKSEAAIELLRARKDELMGYVRAINTILKEDV